MDDHFRLVAGALSSTPERAAASAAALGLEPARSYASFEAMARAEAARPDGTGIGNGLGGRRGQTGKARR